jgi:hypothetical protein
MTAIFLILRGVEVDAPGGRTFFYSLAPRYDNQDTHTQDTVLHRYLRKHPVVEDHDPHSF